MPHGTGRFRCTGARFALVCAAAALLSLWIRSGVPAFAIAWASDDDALFLRQARFLAEGHWLGPFDKWTLVKGMGYPAFIAASFWAGIPLKWAEQGAYLAACLLPAMLLRRRLVAGSPLASWAPAALFVVLALDPTLWSAELARIIREGLYVSLSLAVVVLGVWISFHGRRPAATLALGLLLGLLGGAFALTREEGVWLLPALAVSFGLGGLAAWRARDGRGAMRAAAAWAAAAAVASALVLGVARVNAARYGAFEDNEVQSLPFRRAYGALARIHQASPRRWVVLPKDARDAAYAASPAARELAPVLDGPTGDSVRRSNCEQDETGDCSEILSGWFQWVLRDAVTAAGHYGSAAEAAAYYTRLADEIDGACARGRLSCGPSRAALAPPLSWSDIVRSAQTFPRLVRVLWEMDADRIGAPPSEGDAPALAAMADMVGPVSPTLTVATTIRGWVAAAGGIPDIRPAPGEAATVALEPAPDVAALHPGETALRFTLKAGSAGKDDGLLVDLAGKEPSAVPMDQLKTGATLLLGSVTLHVEGRVVPTVTGDARRTRILGMARRIAAFYAGVVPAASLLGGLGLAAALLRRKRVTLPPEAVALALSSGVAVLSRLALLSYLDAVAIPAVNGLYASPASPLLLLFAASGCGLGVAALMARPR